MVGRGKLTTIISNIALIAGGIYAAKTVTPDALIQIIIMLGVLIIAIADVKYPRLMDQLESALDGQSEDPEEPQ